MAKKFLTLRVWIFIFALVFALFAINPRPWAEGIVVSGVGEQSIEAQQGFQTGEKILKINNQPITTLQDYRAAIQPYQKEGKNITVEAGNLSYTYAITNSLGFTIDANLTIIDATFAPVATGVSLQSINGMHIENASEFENAVDNILPAATIIIATNKKEYAYLSRGNVDLRVREAPKNNIKKGLELAGGTRVVIQPENENNATVTDQNIQDLISVLENRLNVYGLADLKIRASSDLAGSKFVVVEIAGATREEVQELIGKQGKFEARIGNETVFIGGRGDIPFVCRNDGSCSGIVPPCSQQDSQWACQFRFQIKLSQEAAQRHAEVTREIEVVGTPGDAYLSKTLDMYLDDRLVNTLNIGSDLKGQEVTDIVISGPGRGATEREAADNALKEMNRLQTILITGSLPLKISIVKSDTISPALGEEFLKNSIFVGLVALVMVGIIVYLRYRTLKIALPIMAVVSSEIFITLGIASLIGWNMDLASIAGLIAAVGTGVDDQIIITDEALRKETEYLNWKQKIKRAFSIILGAYLTVVAAMLPLWNAGAGLVRGFAVTTIIGVTIGVLITRPAFASIISSLLEE
ncbi:MAG TPA: PDZ domain-containing protein [Candidatus Nanoarchaeia archaeon]|nr:PDZ domain-containing protein [Candidatus Nanoarchaeia archaeon]